MSLPEMRASQEQTQAVQEIQEIIQRVDHQWSRATSVIWDEHKNWYLFTAINNTSELAETIRTLKHRGVISDDFILYGRADGSHQTVEFLLNPKYFNL